MKVAMAQHMLKLYLSLAAIAPPQVREGEQVVGGLMSWVAPQDGQAVLAGFLIAS